MKRVLPLVLAMAMTFPSLAFAHGGGLDAYGGHNDRKHGGYHVHRGPLAGKSYPSKAAMLEDLRRQGRGDEQGKKAGDGKGKR